MMAFGNQRKQDSEGATGQAHLDASAELTEQIHAVTGSLHSDAQVATATSILSDRYPAFLATANETRSKNESRFVLLGLLLIVVMVLIAWSNWDQRYFHTDSDLVYYMGLCGGIMLLLTLLYSLRKRFRFMKKLGDMSYWYYLHLCMGVVGPVLVIFHSSFSMRSLNSSVALIAMLCIIFSGILGRYIYTRIGYQVHGRLLAIRQTEDSLAKSLNQYSGESADMIRQSLSELTERVVNMPQSIFHIPARFFALRGKAAKCYVNGIHLLAKAIKARAEEQQWDRLSYLAELDKKKRVLREHVNALVKIGQLHFYERLLVGWRVFHIPLIFILFISGSVHVFAVHWY